MRAQVTARCKARQDAALVAAGVLRMCADEAELMALAVSEKEQDLHAQRLMHKMQESTAVLKAAACVLKRLRNIGDENDGARGTDSDNPSRRAGDTAAANGNPAPAQGKST